MKKHLLIFFLALALGVSLNAQKFGYINSSQLLVSMPEIKEADKKLEAYQNELIGKGEQMVQVFEGNYRAYLASVDKGELSQVQMAQQENALSNEQKAIQEFEVEVQQLLAQRKQVLYQPVLKKVQDLVNQIAKEQGYSMIFDASIGGILFATEGDDLMPLFKERLGI